MLTIGEILLKSRISKHLELSDIARELHLSERYLHAIEENNWSLFTSKVYMIGTLRLYAAHLGMDPSNAVAYFRRDFDKKESLHFRTRLSSLSFFSDTKKIVLIAIGLMCGLFTTYFGYQLYQSFSPPSVTIVLPTARIFRNVEKIRVVGKTKKESTVKIFNDVVYPDENGLFYYDLPLVKGDNFISIEVTGPNGRSSKYATHFTRE